MSRSYHKNTETEKWCYKCEKYCSKDLFKNEPSRYDGLSNKCAACKKLQDRRRIRKIPGATILIFDQLSKEQSNRCAICNKHQEEFSKRLAIDHDHATSKIRGLLCEKCNLGLGNFQDNITFMKSAIKYLEKFEDKDSNYVRSFKPQ